MASTPPAGFQLDPDLQAWVGRCQTPPDMTFLFAANQFIQTGKTAGWWQLLSAIYFLCAPTLQAATQNVRSNSFNLTQSATPVNFAPYIGVWTSSAGPYLYTAGATITDICGPGITNTNILAVYNHNISTAQYGGALLKSGEPYGQAGASDGSYQTFLNINMTVGSSTENPTALVVNNNNTQSVVVNLPLPSVYGPGIGLNCNIRFNSSVSVSAGIFWNSGTGSIAWPTSISNIPPSGNSANLYFVSIPSISPAKPPYSPSPISFAFAGAWATERPVEMAQSLSNACDQFLKLLGVWVDPIDPPYTVSSLLGTPPPLPNCFTSGDTVKALSNTPGLRRIFQVAGPPGSNANDPTYPSYPVTDCIVTPTARLLNSTTQTQVKLWDYLSVDRALGGPGPIYPAYDQKYNSLNDVSNIASEDVGVQFTTYANAIGSTLVRVMYSAGYLAQNDPDGANIAALLKQFGYPVANTNALGWLDAAYAFGYDVAAWLNTTGYPGYINSPYNLYTDQNINTLSTTAPLGPAVVHQAFANANADTFFYAPPFGNLGYPQVNQVALNMVVLDALRLVDLADPALNSPPQPIAGFYLDWETDDDRGSVPCPSGITDLFTVTALLVAAAAHGKGFQIIAGFDPLNGGGSHVGITTANAGIVLADPSPLYPAGGLDFIAISTVDAPPPAPGPVPGDLELAALEAQIAILRNAVPPIPNLVSKLMLQLSLSPPFQEIPRLYANSARNFLIQNNIPNCSVAAGLNSPGGPLSRPYNQVLATFFGLAIF